MFTTLIGEHLGRISRKRSSFSNCQTKMESTLVIGGDFNIICYAHKRRGGRGNGHDRLEFNSLIDQAELIDLPIADRSFTWSTLQDRLILARLDRVLLSVEWETHFPLTTLRTLPRPISDHTPLCLDTEDTLIAKMKIFRFAKIWLEEPDVGQSSRTVGISPLIVRTWPIS